MRSDRTYASTWNKANSLLPVLYFLMEAALGGELYAT